MAFLYSDLITDFRTLMRDPSALNNNFFTDAEILIWCADANMEAVREAGLQLFTTTLSITVFDGDVADAMTAETSYTTITVDAATCVPPATGSISIENSDGDSQTFNYSSWSLASTTYTFSIDSTEADYSFAANDTVTIYKREYPYPTSVLKIVSVVRADNKRVLPTTINALDEHDSAWRDVTGDIEHYYPTMETGTAGENANIGFYSAPTSAETLKIRAWKLPESSAAAASVATSDGPEVEDSITKLLMDYVLAQGYRVKRDFTQYDKLITKFYAVNLKLIKRFFNRDEDRIMALGSNEGQSGLVIGRYPDGYPRFEK